MFKWKLSIVVLHGYLTTALPKSWTRWALQNRSNLLVMHSSQLNHLTISSTSEQEFPVDKSLPLCSTHLLAMKQEWVCLYCLNVILYQDVGTNARFPVLPQWIMENHKLLQRCFKTSQFVSPLHLQPQVFFSLLYLCSFVRRGKRKKISFLKFDFLSKLEQY